MKVKDFVYIVILTALCIFFSALPFLPGRYFDGVLTLSLLGQIVGLLSIILVPTGIVWLLYARWKKKQFSAVPLYLIIVPSMSLLAQVMLAQPLRDWSRSTAIKNSMEMIHDIEAYHAQHGQYPVSLYAVWPDYLPGIMGISQYYYEPNNDTYNLTFEQPRFLLDDFGAREFVMYNRLDEHELTSHATWRLSHPELQGWYISHDIDIPHWKYFLFD